MNGFNGYNNYNNAAYMPNAYSPAPMMTPVQQPQYAQQDTTVSWVQGRSGAEAYPLAPGRRAMLMDSNEAILYVKQTDATGRYMPLQAYRLVPIEEQSQAPALPQETIDYDKIRQIISEEVSRQTQAHQSPKKEGR